MYDKLSYNIETCEYDDELTMDRWYSDTCGITTDILEAFNEEDWSRLFQEIPGKSMIWKKRLNDCLMNPTDLNQLKVILYLADLDDQELFIDIVKNLIDSDISDINGLEKIYDKALAMQSQVTGTDRKNIDILLENYKNTRTIQV